MSVKISNAKYLNAMAVASATTTLGCVIATGTIQENIVKSYSVMTVKDGIVFIIRETLWGKKDHV